MIRVTRGNAVASRLALRHHQGIRGDDALPPWAHEHRVDVDLGHAVLLRRRKARYRNQQSRER